MPLRLIPHPSTLSRLAFVAKFGGIYEHSPWVAEGVFDAGPDALPDAPEALAIRMAAIVDTAPHDRQLALLRAHPELAGKLALRGDLTPESASEQASARLDQCSAEEFARFIGLNARYTQDFGFPFIIAVRGLQRADILTAFERRVGNSRQAEFAEGLGQVHKIARLRLEALATL